MPLVRAVVLRGQISNPPRPWHTCVQLLAEEPLSETGSDVPSLVRSSDRTSAIQKQRRLTEREIEKLTSDYQSGMTIKRLSDRYRIHRTTVYEHLDRNGVPRRQRGLSPRQIQQAGVLYESGLSLAKVGARFNVDAQTVRDRIAEEGVQIRKRRGSK